MDILLLIVGLGLILAGANFLTDGSAAVAQRFRVPEFIIGLTIVAVGTSTPELVVSVLSAAAGNSDVAIGNVVGSNLFNVFRHPRRLRPDPAAAPHPKQHTARYSLRHGRVADPAGRHFGPPDMCGGGGQNRPHRRHRHGGALHRADVVHDPHHETARSGARRCRREACRPSGWRSS